MNRRSVVLLSVSALAFSSAAGLTACETDTTSGSGPAFELPDGAIVPFDAGGTGFDAGDVADAGDAAAPDASDASDASDGGNAVTYSGLFGSIGGTTYEDRCPPGQLLIGFEGGAVASGFYSGVLSKLRTLCGTPALPVGASPAITIGPGGVVPDAGEPRGSEAVSPAAVQVSCPANQVVVAIRGDTIAKDFPPERDLVAYVEIACAPLAYVNGAVTIGTATSAGGVGGASGTSAGPFECGPNEVAAGVRVHAGDIIDGMEARCEPVVVP